MTVTYTYDRADELINRSDPNGSNTFAYDAFGNLTTSATSFNTATTYTYDAANRLTAITLPGGGNATSSFT